MPDPNTQSPSSHSIPSFDLQSSAPLPPESSKVVKCDGRSMTLSSEKAYETHKKSSTKKSYHIFVHLRDVNAVIPHMESMISRTIRNIWSYMRKSSSQKSHYTFVHLGDVSAVIPHMDSLISRTIGRIWRNTLLGRRNERSGERYGVERNVQLHQREGGMPKLSFSWEW